MGTPYLTADLALAADSDVTALPYVALDWNLASSDAEDWLGILHLGSVAGTVTLQGVGTPLARELLVLSAPADLTGHTVLAETLSDENGAFAMQWQNYTGQVLVLELDDLGEPWTAGSYAEGDLVTPTVWNGWQYECVSGGTSGESEPTWWAGEGATGADGGVVWVARQFLGTLAHGPITPHIEEVL